jgi:hypothetical protein
VILIADHFRADALDTRKSGVPDAQPGRPCRRGGRVVQKRLLPETRCATPSRCSIMSGRYPPCARSPHHAL